MKKMRAIPSRNVTPAQAGVCPIIGTGDELQPGWIPAFAGMTVLVGGAFDIAAIGTEVAR